MMRMVRVLNGIGECMFDFISDPYEQEYVVYQNTNGDFVANADYGYTADVVVLAEEWEDIECSL